MSLNKNRKTKRFSQIRSFYRSPKEETAGEGKEAVPKRQSKKARILRKVRNITLVTLGLVILCGVLGFLVLFGPLKGILENPLFDFLSVSKIECKTQYGACDEKDLKELALFYGKNTLLISTNEVQQHLQTNYKNESSNVQKIFPGQLMVTLQKKKAYAALQKTGIETLALVSKDGVVLAIVKDTALPKITLENERSMPALGERLTEKETNAARIMYLTSITEETTGVLLTENSLAVRLKKGSHVFFPLDREAQVVVGALQLILSRSKMEGQLPVSIDLRYKNPVLKY